MFHTLGTLKNNVRIGKPEPKLRIESERLLAGNCQQIIAPTKQEKSHLIRFYETPEEKIKVIPCGVNLQLFRPLDKQESRFRLGFNDEKIILFVGRIDPIKGIDSLIKSIAYLKDKQKLRLVIIGDDAHSQTLLQRLKKLVDDLDLKENVIFRGIVPQEELPYYYSAADVCSVVSHYESFGLVALEALACGTPVVARNVGILNQVIRQRENGWVLKRDHSPEELAEKLAFFLYGNKGSSVSHCRAAAIPFGWKNIAEQMNQVMINLPQSSTISCLST
jgi:D-inositol-3-phosphate glycosyltransferase